MTDGTTGGPVRRVVTGPDVYDPTSISQAVGVGDLVFVSGQVGVDANGLTVAGDFAGQARQAFRNLERVLTAAGTGLDHVAKVTILVTVPPPMDDVVALRREFFSRPYPADTIAQVVSLAQPDWLIEIEAIAVRPGGSAPD
ncbi:RidA family protein [Kineosporia succinea]|uniref:Enamine deaminase RidA (YjgF/YER057c/UK114 family) n=1 Tax=Kineosporia succinea TaxID=84632 RepID=A0ABT9NV14_9ACTN|nr:RidA family protein [Kineosporia succinea]MDP9824269.1 enamine deaminase RidA (YjgF/YER057c/UK114 family) [Kineosporia succinea]